MRILQWSGQMRGLGGPGGHRCHVSCRQGRDIFSSGSDSDCIATISLVLMSSGVRKADAGWHATTRRKGPISEFPRVWWA